MIQRLFVALVAVFFVLSAQHAVAHDHKVKVQVKGKIVEKTVDFKGWMGGAKRETDCCDGRHCRVAVSYVQLDNGSWRFSVPVYTNSPSSPLEPVDVPDNEVSRGNPAEDSNAYWCGNFNKVDGKWVPTNRCAFIPKLTN